MPAIAGKLNPSDDFCQTKTRKKGLLALIMFSVIVVDLFCDSCVTRMSKHSGHTLPGVEVKDADGFIGAAGGHVLTRGIDLNLPHPTRKSLLVSLSIYVCI